MAAHRPTFQQAKEALDNLIAINLTPEKQYTLKLFIDQQDQPSMIKYTLIMESTTHKVIEIRRIESNFQQDWFLEQCQQTIFAMEQTLKETSTQAGIKMSDIL